MVVNSSTYCRLCAVPQLAFGFAYHLKSDTPAELQAEYENTMVATHTGSDRERNKLE